MAIYFEPAECWIHCQEEMCPYTHTDLWRVIAEDDGCEYGPFLSEELAKACEKKHSLETIEDE